jgi:hypothetical protein
MLTEDEEDLKLEVDSFMIDYWMPYLAKVTVG